MEIKVLAGKVLDRIARAVYWFGMKIDDASMLLIYGEERPEIAPELAKQLHERHVEEYYNNKLPKVDVLYNGRSLPDGTRVDVDVRNFWNPHDSVLRGIVEGNNLKKDTWDDTALACLHYVVSNYKYVWDHQNKYLEGQNEFWAYAYEEVIMKVGDCEDLNNLVANLMLVAGIPYYRIRMNAGWANSISGKVGHHYVSYCRESDDEFVPLDATFHVDTATPIKDREPHSKDKSYAEIWFSWNMRYAYNRPDYNEYDFESHRRLKSFKVVKDD